MLIYISMLVLFIIYILMLVILMRSDVYDILILFYAMWQQIGNLNRQLKQHLSQGLLH